MDTITIDVRTLVDGMSLRDMKTIGRAFGKQRLRIKNFRKKHPPGENESFDNYLLRIKRQNLSDTQSLMFLRNVYESYRGIQ